MARLGLLATGGGGLLMVAGSFMKWSDAGVLSVVGTDEPMGYVTAFMGGLIVVVGLARYSMGSRASRATTAVVSVLAIVVALYTVWYALNQGYFGEVGPGPKFITAGAIAVVVGMFSPGREPTTSTAT